ncbi:MAG: hypothetical protein PUB32_00095 [Clostridiales bacterium]|nr:hypothetical protein [Clostridiales bacterium]
MNWLRRFMAGRYGPDQLSFAMLIVALVLNLAASILRMALISSLSAVLIVLCFYRMFSRNYEKRRAENQKFMGMWYRIKNFFRRQKDKMRQGKNFRFFKCPSCKNNLRVPKGKGKIYVTCPRCGERFIKKT